MKKVTFAALLVLTAPQFAVAANDRDVVMEKLADMIALNALCPRWVAQERMLMLAVSAFDINLDEGSADSDALQKLSREKVALMRVQAPGKEEATACLAAKVLYGSTGTNGAGMMREQ